jgi:hypothetical protein
VHGMDLSLIVGGSAALAGVVLALIFVPRRTPEAVLDDPSPVLAESGT